MLLESVNFEEFDSEGGGNTPSPKKKNVGEKRKRDEEKEEKKGEEEKKEKEENDKKRIRRGGGRWNGRGRYVENVSVTTTMQFGTPLSFLFLQSSLMQISSRQITIINNYYYQPRWRGGGGQGQPQGQHQGQCHGQDLAKYVILCLCK